MKKRGVLGRKGEVEHEIYFIIFEIFLVLMVAIALFSYVDKEAKNTYIVKSYLAKDVSLLVNTIYASPGDIYYEYEHTELPYFDYKFDKLKVEVFDPGLKGAVYYQIAPDDSKILNSFTFTTEMEAPQKIKVSKSGDNVDLGKISSTLYKITVPQIRTTDLDWEKNMVLMLDPGHGSSMNANDDGFVNALDRGFIEADVNFAVALAAKLKFIGLKNDIAYLREKAEYKDTDDRRDEIRNKQPSIVISLHFGSEQDKAKNPVQAYVSQTSVKAVESYKLAALITNNLIDDVSGITSARVNYIDPNAATDPILKVLDNDQVHVYLELGNIQIPEDSNAMFKQKNEVAGAIHKAIGEYYG